MQVTQLPKSISGKCLRNTVILAGARDALPQMPDTTAAFA